MLHVSGIPTSPGRTSFLCNSPPRPRTSDIPPAVSVYCSLGSQKNMRERETFSSSEATRCRAGTHTQVPPVNWCLLHILPDGSGSRSPGPRPRYTLYCDVWAKEPATVRVPLPVRVFLEPHTHTHTHIHPESAFRAVTTGTARRFVPLARDPAPCGTQPPCTGTLQAAAR